MDVSLESIRVLADGDDAAGDDGLDVERSGAGDQLVALRAGIQPDFRNLLPRDLADDLLADLRRHDTIDAMSIGPGTSSTDA